MRNRRSKRVWTIVMIVCAVIALACVGTLIWIQIQRNRVEQTLANAVIQPAEQTQTVPGTATSVTPTRPVTQPSAEQPEPKTEEPGQTAERTPAEEPVTEPAEPTPSETPENPQEEPPVVLEPITIPIDFDYLQQTNPDIYAWLRIPCTEQEYPVLQNAADTDYYLHHDIFGNYIFAGSLYSQGIYNSKQLDDPCTIIYGHNMSSGEMFGKLEDATQALDLDNAEDENNYFTIYTPDKAFTYRIACVGSYSDKHVLYFYNFAVEDDFHRFFEELSTYPVGLYRACADFAPAYGDRLVILATCKKNDSNYRYLTIGVLVEERDGR